MELLMVGGVAGFLGCSGSSVEAVRRTGPGQVFQLLARSKPQKEEMLNNDTPA